MANRRRLVLVFALLLTITIGVAAQSNETIDQILGQEVATIGSAAYVTLSAAGLVNDDSTPAKAVEVAVEAGWLGADKSAQDPAGFGQLAHLLMQAFEIKGGLMYRIFPGPRYATREFTYFGWSPIRVGPADQISGEFLLSVTGIFLEDLAGGTQGAER
jgi:hypothetical protein